MKKIIALLLAMTMLSGLAACGSTKEEKAGEETSQTETNAAEGSDKNAGENVDKETITIKAMNESQEMADIKVPFNPEKIAVLDMAALDILDSIGVGDRVVGSAAVSIEYLKDYNPDDSKGGITNLGTVKTADLEKVAACEPDVIFIGGRLSSIYNELEQIAPVVFLPTDYEKGVVESTKENAKTIASMFGKEDEVDALMEGYTSRIEKLNEVLKDKDILMCMYNANAVSLMDTESALNILVSSLGGKNIGETVGEQNKSTHGEEASWETIIKLNPEYMFALDRSTAIGETDEAKGAKETVENDLIKKLDVYKNGNIVYFIKNANVWYTSTGGIKALDTMLTDLEEALLKN